MKNETLLVSYNLRNFCAEIAGAKILAGATPIVVLSIYVPSEKDRIRNKQTPRINAYQLWGKGTEVLPN